MFLPFAAILCCFNLFRGSGPLRELWIHEWNVAIHKKHKERTSERSRTRLAGSLTDSSSRPMGGRRCARLVWRSSIEKNPQPSVYWRSCRRCRKEKQRPFVSFSNKLHRTGETRVRRRPTSSASLFLLTLIRIASRFVAGREAGGEGGRLRVKEANAIF